MAKEFCRECGYQLHRSRSRGAHEKFVKALSRSKLYRCHECGWRGWIAPARAVNLLPLYRRLLPYLLVLVVTVLILVLVFTFTG